MTRSPLLPLRLALCAAAVLVSSAWLGCQKPDPAAQCKAACDKVIACGLTRLTEGMDCANACQNLRTFPECPSCLAGSRTTCEDIATARVCGGSCRIK